MWMDQEPRILSDPAVGCRNQNFECLGGTGGAPVGTSGPSKNPRRLHRSPGGACETRIQDVSRSVLSMVVFKGHL
jgi:hypothetical protein